MADITFPCEEEGVLQLLPHRQPFVWVTRILECDPGHTIRAALDIAPNLALFKGHFPQYPVMPGVIIMESLAQAAACCLMAGAEDTDKLGFLVGIDKARFKRQALPGDTLELRAEITRNAHGLCVADVSAYKEGELVASATQKYMMASPDKIL
ncbi:MAG: 3-hydroxyacyl-ACP dehydratase FabZ [Eggerthellaceae bacterium]|nr:3-hydroxyacyl-ACP dehydratase FabZ [Eggerthellaceae bacterium]